MADTPPKPAHGAAEALAPVRVLIDSLLRPSSDPVAAHGHDDAHAHPGCDAGAAMGLCPALAAQLQVCSHSDAQRAALAALYYELLDAAAAIHPHLFTEFLTPLGSPRVPRREIASPALPSQPPNSERRASTPATASTALVERLNATVRDQAKVISKLERNLEVEKGLNKVLRNDNVEIKKHMVKLAAATEQEEEALTNMFLGRIEEMQKEKARILEQVEREEEYITNTLQRKLLQLQREKVEIENHLEVEQENIVNRLQKQLDALRNQQLAAAEESTHSLSLAESGRRRGGTSGSSIHEHSPSLEALPAPMADILRAEVQGLKFKLQEAQREAAKKDELIKAWRDELLILRQKAGLPIDDLFKAPSPVGQH